ncbi:hypothetical protein ANN_02494 [Periplaneta americana]|uniref:Vacuolar protein sorting-associated protein 51 homolog n=1 Tax=Periplaneta americana TaxID=6978 RepID=A0ABQ8TY73_PERAM|nr:hypothetical protein ANN_02494 [Periplaneta americana]
MAGLCEGGNEPSGSLKAICNEVTATNSWIANKKGLSISLKMIANLAAVRSVPGRSLDGTRCRHGCPEIETLAHVLGFCEQGLLLRNSRHHLVRSKIAAALRNKGWIVEEISCLAENGSTRRVDILAYNADTKQGIIVDPTIRFEVGCHQSAEVHLEKKSIYEPTVNYFKLKYALIHIEVFAQSDLTFGLKPHFREAFCIDNVREDLVVGFLHHLTATARGFCDSGDSKSPLALLLLLSKMCLEFETSSVHYLLSQTDEWFNIEDRHGSGILTGEAEICNSMRAAAQELLNHYVRMQGLSVSQMLRKSVETRDWLHTIEPRTVRAVMKRVVEDIAAVDSQVGALYEEGQRAERSSDSSRRTHSASVSRHVYRSNWSSYAPSQLDSSLVTNIQKLFSERIEIFSSVEFSKVSILTGIIKISLKGTNEVAYEELDAQLISAH